MIFFDEIDALCPRRSSGSDHSGSNRVVTQMLTEMDGYGSRKGVYIMAATNRQEIVDPAITRPGRLETTLYVGLPDTVERELILNAITRKGTKPKLATDVDVKTIAKASEGYSGADLKALITKASELAFSEDIAHPELKMTPQVKKTHFEKALKLIRQSVQGYDKDRYEKMRQKFTRKDIIETDTPKSCDIQQNHKKIDNDQSIIPSDHTLLVQEVTKMTNVVHAEAENTMVNDSPKITEEVITDKSIECCQTNKDGNLFIDTSALNVEKESDNISGVDTVTECKIQPDKYTSGVSENEEEADTQNDTSHASYQGCQELDVSSSKATGVNDSSDKIKQLPEKSKEIANKSGGIDLDGEDFSSTNDFPEKSEEKPENIEAMEMDENTEEDLKIRFLPDMEVRIKDGVEKAGTIGIVLRQEKCKVVMQDETAQTLTIAASDLETYMPTAGEMAKITLFGESESNFEVICVDKENEDNVIIRDSVTDEERSISVENLCRVNE